MRKEYMQSAKTELERLQKQGNTAANRRAAEQRAPREQELRHAPETQKGDLDGHP